MTEATAEKNPTEQVLELCAALEAGEKARLAELAPLLDRRHKEMNKGFSGFLKAVEEKGEEYEQTLAAEISHVEEQFTAYDEALKVIGRYEQEKNAALLKQGATALQEAAAGLRMAMQRYEERFLSLGPSRFLMVNFFTNLARYVRFGKTPVEAWNAACERYQEFYGRALEEIDKSAHKDKTGVAERRAAVESIIGTVGTLLSQGPKNKVEENLSTLSEHLMKLEGAVEAYNSAEVANGPTSSPRANMVITAAQGVMEKRFRPEVLKDLATAFLAIVQKSISEVQQLSRNPGDSVLLAEESAKILEGMEAVEDALLLLQSYGEGQAVETKDVEHAIEQIVANVDKLHGSAKTVTSFNESSGKVMCPGCHTANSPGTRICSNCQRSLPMLGMDAAKSSFQVMEGGDEDPQAPKWVMTDKIQALFDAFDGFDKGTVSAEEVQAHLEETEEALVRAEEQVASLVVPEFPDDVSEASPEDLEWAREIRQLGIEGLAAVNEGLAECRQGLQLLHACLRPHSWEELNEAKRVYFWGIQKALKIQEVAAMFLKCTYDRIKKTNPEFLQKFEGHEPEHDGEEGGDAHPVADGGGDLA